MLLFLHDSGILCTVPAAPQQTRLRMAVRRISSFTRVTASVVSLFEILDLLERMCLKDERGAYILVLTFTVR
jgi:hypothetical protein